METMMQAQTAQVMEQTQYAFHAWGTVAFMAVGGVTLIGSLLGILYMTFVIAPNVTQRCSSALRERNILSFFVGLLVFGGFVGLGAIGTHAPVVGGIAVVAFGILTILAYAAASEDIGRRLFWACGKEGSRASHLAGGWLVFAFGSLFPVLGWFIILPYVTLSGLGSIVVGALSSSKPRDVDFTDMTK